MGLAFTSRFFFLGGGWVGKKSCKKKILNAEQSRRACRNSRVSQPGAPRKQPALLKSVPWCRGD